MGKGRKTGTLSEKGIYDVNWARNLPINKLAAVIFGCKNHTIDECFDREVFGLPAAHFSYVKNITPGLPLFLFNYSDRMLHGIFEAASSGQMNINRHSWTTAEGAECTPYPAQVRVSEVWKCRPLPEEKFKPLIKNNYYEERLFYFELDKGQYTRLRTLFLSSPLQEKMPRPSSSLQVKMPHPQNAARQNNSFNALSSSEGYSGTSETLQEKEHSHALVGNRDDFASSWAGLFRKPSLPPNSLKNGETLDSSFEERSEQPVEVSFDSANAECDTDDVECWEDRAFMDDYMNETYPVEVGCSQHQDRENDVPELPYCRNRGRRVRSHTRTQ